ncbi:MAG: phosphate acyltransferase PlsX [Gammaproteobacteria bacterium]|nr:MAG: phosphate acyltransferase PlsX [Gammaproteobacteria bacterium]
MKIALDAMGGDNGVDVVVSGALLSLADNSELELTLVGDEEAVKATLARQEKYQEYKDRITIKHASQKVAMDESPAVALRTKKDSSIRVAVNLVKDGTVDACVSAGNTGALMATAKYVLKTLPGIDRPAIMKTLPTSEGVVRLLDLGANVDCSADNLLQFAVMGSVYAEAVDKIKEPRVGLLNVGQEEIKGNDEVKQASKLLSETELNYIGYVEGDGVFFNDADVVVCDGFVGNISLKIIEGLAKMIGLFLQHEYKRNLFSKLAAIISIPVLKRLKRRIDPGRYNGASLLGLRGIVIKSHGSASAVSFSHAIANAVSEVKNNVPDLIDKRLDSLLSEKAEN